MLINSVVILSMSLALVFSQTSVAVTVHTWKDENGVTHFSDEPAPQGVKSNTVEFDKIDSAQKLQTEDFYSIANQWRRLKAERDASRERLEAKAKRLAAERQAAYELQAAREANSYPSNPVVYGPINPAGLWGTRGYGYGQPGAGYGYPHAHSRARARVHKNYYSPFHDRPQPQSIRPKPLSNRPSAYRGRSSGAHASFFVRF